MYCIVCYRITNLLFYVTYFYVTHYTLILRVSIVSIVLSSASYCIDYLFIIVIYIILTLNVLLLLRNSIASIACRIILFMR